MADAQMQINEATVCAMQSDDAQLQFDAFSRAGVVFIHARKFDIALTALDRSEQIATKANLSLDALHKTWTNRGACLMESGFFRRATESFDRVLRATEHATSEGAKGSHQICLTNLIFISLASGKSRDALVYAERFLAAERPDLATSSSENTVIFEGWYATALAQTGQHEVARNRLSAVRQRIAPEALGSNIQFSIALAVTEVHGGFVDQGVTRLRETVALAEHKNLFYTQALQALTLVLEHIGQIAEALQCVEKLEKVMKEAARGIVGIEELDENAEPPSVSAAEVRAGAASEDEQIEELEDPTNSSIRILDDRAAQLRIRRFMELTHDERATVLDRIAVASALVDDETGQHCARVELLTLEFCRALGIAESRAKLISAGARMHDLGKIGIPHRVLLAPRKLTPMEFEIAKKHVPIGADLLSFSEDDVVKMAKIIAQSHHEKWDGSGYPKKLYETAIPIEARITSIVDVFDVLTHKRAYKRAWSVEQARDEIEFMADKHFDPHLVEVFLTQVVKPDYVIPTEFPNEAPAPIVLRDYSLPYTPPPIQQRRAAATPTPKPTPQFETAKN